ncbi:hypothetical protein DM02DRAFT_136850 [Periconia macrospinosa]|uniref:Uncharacterized protein n=1 Tax=Periconia macrospinosa TaxID=97972 RepID=A0A2V1DCS9_9PLEO|nr:hypothetical protein DM02DRAFT_136850 [Periconia macrospinosa]
MMDRTGIAFRAIGVLFWLGGLSRLSLSSTVRFSGRFGIGYASFSLLPSPPQAVIFLVLFFSFLLLALFGYLFYFPLIPFLKTSIPIFSTYYSFFFMSFF